MRERRILIDVGNRGTAKSILKRDTLDEFVDGVLGKMTRNKYTKVSQMDDIVRGRFDMADQAGVDKVAAALQNTAGIVGAAWLTYDRQIHPAPTSLAAE